MKLKGAKDFLNRWKDTVLVVSYHGYDEDTGEKWESHTEHDAKSVLRVIVTDGYHEKDEIVDVADESIVSLAYQYIDGGDGCGTLVETKKTYDNRRRNERRQRLEDEAADICRRYDCKPNTLEFLHALDMELERFKTYREGMREDGLCIGYGVTVEQWYDEFNASRGDSEHIYEIMEWVEEFCPLLWMEYCASKEKEKVT